MSFFRPILRAASALIVLCALGLDARAAVNAISPEALAAFRLSAANTVHLSQELGRMPSPSFGSAGAILAPPVGHDISRASLVGGVVSFGATDPRAVPEARMLLGRMLEEADPVILQRAARVQPSVIVMAKDKDVLDLAPVLRAISESWPKMGFTFQFFDGRIVSLVDEREILGPTLRHGDVLGSTLAHEFGHFIHMAALSAPQATAISETHRIRMSLPEKTGLGIYSEQDEFEHFAEGVSAFFGMSTSGGGRTSRLFPAVNPEMYGIIRRIFGSQRDLRP